MHPQDFKVFIASSLSLTQDRQEVEDAINEINQDILKDSFLHFSIFDYVKEEKIVQKLELGDAQEPIRRFLYESLVFVLIIRGRVGNLTVSEFEDAITRFREGRLPQYIFIFYDEDHSRDSIDDEKSISFPEFESRYLAKYELDSACRLIKHEKGYYIPFGGKFEPLKSQLIKNISSLLRSDECPFPGAIRTNNLKKYDFYTDENRLSQCHENIYFSRPFDKRLEESFDNNNIIFINGVSLSGKTRAAMNLLSKRDDGWVYLLSGAETIDREDIVINEMERIVKYFDTAGVHPTHYIFMDDAHDFDFSEDEDNKNTKQQRKIIESFLEEAIKGKFKLIITSTRKFQDTFLSSFINEDDNNVITASIREMRDAEFSKAVNFFNGYGLVKHDKRFGYNTPGAILIDLANIKNTYSDYLKVSQERMLTVRRCFLKSIKAASIWKNTNFGEISILYRLTGYFLEQERIDDWTEKEINKAISSILSKPQCGITKIGDTRLNIQEYVYRYLIDYDGDILKDDCNLPEAEKHLVDEIMSYCLQYEKSSPLTLQACKLGSRSEYRSVIGPWLYKLFIDNSESSKKPWIVALRKERLEKELHPLQEDEDRYLFYYSKMFSNAFDFNADFTQALSIFNTAKPELCSPNLLADLMIRAQTDNDWHTIVSLPEYKKYVLEEKRPFVLTRLMSLQRDFSRTLSYFNVLKQNINYTPVQIARFKLKALDMPIRDENDRQIQHDIFPIERGIEFLARNVKSESDFSTLIDIIRQCYFIKVNERSILIEISEKKMDILSRKDDLTIIDLLSILSVLSLRRAIQGAFGSQSNDKKEIWNDFNHAIEYFIRGNVYPSVQKTLSNHFTDETKLRNTVSTIINALIEAYASQHDSFPGLSYAVLREHLVINASITHPLHPERMINFMDCYAYSHILKARDCGVTETRNLLEEYLIPHIHDNNNPVVISVYLLNSMISTIWRDNKNKSKDKERTEKTRRAVIQKILPLYEHFHVSPDIYTYNILLGLSQDEGEAVQHITQMVRDGFSPDLYSLGHLASKIQDIRGVLGLIDLPEEITLPNNYELREVLPSVVRDLDTFTAQKAILLDTEEFWKQVFFRELKNDEDRRVAQSCLDYLASYKPELLSDGVLKNVFIQNKSNLINFESIKAFIMDNYGPSFPDNFTISLISNRLTELHGNDKRNHLHFYNELTLRLYKEGRLEWDNLIPRRLALFESFNEHLDLLFLDKDEEDNDVFTTKNVTALGYLHVIKAKEYNPNKKWLYDNLRAIGGYTPEIQRQANEIFPFTPQYDHNQRIRFSYQTGKISSIWEAMKMIDWRDYTSATHTFNCILDIWSKKSAFDPNRFDVVMKLYEEFLSQKGPSSETFSIMVKDATDYQDVIEYLYPAFDSAKKIRNELRLDGHFLSSVYKFGHSFEDLKQYTQVFEDREGVPTIGNTASMIRYMLRYNNDPLSINELKEVTDFLFGSNIKSLATHPSPISLLTKDTVTGQILYSIIVFAENNHMYSREDLITTLVAKYRKELLNFNDDGLFIQLLKQKRNTNKQFLSILLTRLLENENLIQIPDSILSAAVEGIDNYGEYCRLVVAIRRSGCIYIEPIVLPLINHLYKWIRIKNHPLLTDIRKLYSRIVTYSKLNTLNNGHFLPNYSEHLCDDTWCIRSLNNTNVRAIVQEVVGKRTLIEQIEFAVRNLPGPYVLALQSIYSHEKPRLEIDEKSKSFISSFEKDFATSVLKGKVDFNKLNQIPREWERSGWIPGTEIVSALYIKYKECSLMSSDEIIKEEALGYISAINSSIKLANKNKWTSLRIYYSALGKPAENQVDRHHHARIDKQLFSEITDDYLERAIANNEVPFDVLVQLSAEWYSIEWRPTVGVLAALFIQYKTIAKSCQDIKVKEEARKYYLSMCSVINRAKKADSNVLKFFFNDLGRCEDKKHWIVVNRQAFYELTKSTIRNN